MEETVQPISQTPLEMGLSQKALSRLLLENDFLTPAQLKKSLNIAKKSNIPLSEAIIQQDLISDDNLGKLIADNLKVPFISLAKVAIPDPILRIIPENFAKKQKIIVFDDGPGGTKIATPNPINNQALGLIERKTGQNIQVYFATQRDIDRTLNLYKKKLQTTFNELLRDIGDAEASKNAELPVAKIVDTLIEYAYDTRASDIHIEPAENESLVRFRIDGILHDQLRLPRFLHDQILTRVKVLSRLRTDEHLSAQDGKMKVKLKEEEVDIRISIVPIIDGEKCVMRLLTSRFRQFGLTDLGMNSTDLEKVKTGFTKPYGMILSTGPTGSGKTTSMYAILKILNTREKNIATIEDPVEYDIDGINQIQVNPKTNLTFAEGLRSILRQDPDIIYVGEIRDNETADIAINSAMTGHLVLSTLHTNDAATALPRLIDMNIEPFLVSSTVNVIVAQRLVRKICEKCRVSYTEDFEALSKHLNEEMVKKHFGADKQVRLYHGKGCPVCHGTGYDGRIGVFEVLVVSEAIQEMISSKKDSDVIANQAIKEGMTTMLEDGLDKVQEGLTTIEEVFRVTKE